MPSADAAYDDDFVSNSPYSIAYDNRQSPHEKTSRLRPSLP